MAKFRMELDTHHIDFLARISIKGQAIADFLVELPVDDLTKSPPSANNNNPNLWTMYVDGSNNMHGSELDIVLTSTEGTQIEHHIRLNFNTSNN